MSDKNKKFLFDLNNFDTYFEEEQKKKPVEPTFSLQDMEDARVAAFEKGKAEGAQIAKDSIEQRTEILVQSLMSNRSVATHICLCGTILKKLLPNHHRPQTQSTKIKLPRHGAEKQSDTISEPFVAPTYGYIVHRTKTHDPGIQSRCELL